MGELNKHDEESVNRYIDTMFDSDFSYGEIKERLISSYNFTQYEADIAINKTLKTKLYNSIKKGILIVAVMLFIVLVMCVLYFYFKHKEDEIARYMIDKGNGINLGNGTVMVKGPFGYHEMFGKYAIYSVIAAIVVSFRILINWARYRKL